MESVADVIRNKAHSEGMYCSPADMFTYRLI